MNSALHTPCELTVKKVSLPVRTWDIARSLLEEEAKRTGRNLTDTVNIAITRELLRNPDYHARFLAAIDADPSKRELKDLIEMLASGGVKKKKK